MSLATLRTLLVSLSFFTCTSLFATPLVVDVTGIQSHGNPGDPDNTVLNFHIGAYANIVSIGYAVGLSATDPSYLSEFGVLLTGSDQGDGIFVAPGFAESFPGTGVYSGFANLAEIGLSLQVGADGILRLEFFEFYDDFLGSDGQWDFGTITFNYEVAQEVPEPASGLLIGAGLAMMGYSVRRRAGRSASRGSDIERIDFERPLHA